MATKPGDALRATLLCVLTLAGAAGCGGPTAQPAASPTPPPRASAPTRSSARTAGWVLVAVGAHAAAIAAGTSVMMLHENGVRSDGCGPDRVCDSEGLRANDRLRDLGPWNAGAWIVAAAATGGGLFLLLSSRADGAKVGVGAGSGGAVLTGSF